MATLGVGFKAIIPKRPDVVRGPQMVGLIEFHLARWAGDMVDAMAEYPPQEPPTGARQSLGYRFGSRYRRRTLLGARGYRRTGRLGRGWRISARRAGRSVTVSNAVPYTVYVQGPNPGPLRARQTPLMAGKGWKSITREANRRWDREVRALNRDVLIFARSPGARTWRALR